MLDDEAAAATLAFVTEVVEVLLMMVGASTFCLCCTPTECKVRGEIGGDDVDISPEPAEKGDKGGGGRPPTLPPLPLAFVLVLELTPVRLREGGRLR